jgi:hypothetical protein
MLSLLGFWVRKSRYHAHEILSTLFRYQDEETMREVRTEITIHAAPAKVWSLLLDFPSYPLWNPFILRIRGIPELGATLECCPRLPGNRRPMTFRPRITRLEPERTFAWTGHFLLPGLADGVHFFEILPLEESPTPDTTGPPWKRGGIRLVHRQEYRGPLVPVFWAFFGRRTRQGFEQMNEALKDRAERAEETAS